MVLGLSEPVLRGASFAAVLVAMAMAEALWPRRRLTLPRAARWRTNGALVVFDTLMVRVLAQTAAPFAAVAVAAFAGARGFGLLNMIVAPTWAKMIAAFLLLDLAVWAQHVAFHRIGVLWRFHAVHHADRDIDVTTALRFHPGEIAVSALYKSAVVLALGPPVVAVIVFEIALNACAMFNHANVALPAWLDRALRPLIVTPDLHRIHHSTDPREHNANFGFCLSVWDRLFGKFIAQPAAGHHGMTIGLAALQTAAPARLVWSLRAPFAFPARDS